MILCSFGMQTRHLKTNLSYHFRDKLCLKDQTEQIGSISQCLPVLSDARQLGTGQATTGSPVFLSVIVIIISIRLVKFS